MSELFTTVQVQLVVRTCWCGMPHAVPKTLADAQDRDFEDGKPQSSIYCPLGHQHIRSGSTKVQKLERELQRERQQADQIKSDRDYQQKKRQEAEKSLTATKGVVTRLKNRAANGVCPCCNRTFSDLQKHMRSNHPDFAEADSACVPSTK